MYAKGIELQQKLDKIMNYDKCKSDQIGKNGLANYCKQIFSQNTQFYFWSQKEVN